MPQNRRSSENPRRGRPPLVKENSRLFRKIQALHTSGLPPEEIQEETQINTQTVRRTLKKLGLKPWTKQSVGWLPERVQARIRELAAKRAQPWEIRDDIQKRHNLTLTFGHIFRVLNERKRNAR